MVGGVVVVGMGVTRATPMTSIGRVVMLSV